MIVVLKDCLIRKISYLTSVIKKPKDSTTGTTSGQTDTTSGQTSTTNGQTSTTSGQTSTTSVQTSTTSGQTSTGYKWVKRYYKC